MSIYLKFKSNFVSYVLLGNPKIAMRPGFTQLLHLTRQEFSRLLDISEPWFLYLKIRVNVAYKCGLPSFSVETKLMAGAVVSLRCRVQNFCLYFMVWNLIRWPQLVPRVVWIWFLFQVTTCLRYKLRILSHGKNLRMINSLAHTFCFLSVILLNKCY